MSIHTRYATLLEIATLALFLAHLTASDIDTAIWMS